MVNQTDQFLKELEGFLRGTSERLREEFRAVRGNRPSVELLENVKVNYYDQQCTVKQLGSLSLRAPRDIEIQAWDKNAVPAVMKAIEDAKIGMTVTNDGNVIRASLPTLTDERRQEMVKLAKKAAEASRIQVRSYRDEQIKKLKAAQEKDEITEDAFFKTKEKIQKAVDGTNQEIESALDNKIREVGE